MCRTAASAFCGASKGRYGPSSDCRMSCTNERGQFCGGKESNVVYDTEVRGKEFKFNLNHLILGEFQCPVLPRC